MQPRTYPLPENSLIKWEAAPRLGLETIGKIAFHHPLRNTRWDDLEMLYRAGKPLDSSKYVADMHASHAGTLINDGNLVPPVGGQSSYFRLIFECCRMAQCGIDDMLHFPFTDVNQVKQVQDGVEEVLQNDGLNSLDFIGSAYESMDTLLNADSYRDARQIIPNHKAVFESLDSLLERFPDVSSKLWRDIKLILLSSHLEGSPLNDYRRILHAGNITVNVAMGATPAYEVLPGGSMPSMESVDHAVVYEAVKYSYQKVKAFSLVYDSLLLAMTALFLAQAVKKYGLAKVEFGDSISIGGMGHPLFYIDNYHGFKQDVDFFPNDVVFAPHERLMFVTGPTEAGKTTVVRSLGTAVLMGHALGYACAESAMMPLYKKMLSSFVHVDYFERGLSSFRSEVEAFNKHYSAMDENTFYVGDEILRTSEPSVGPDILPYIVDAIIRKGSTGIVATHYHDAVRNMQGNSALNCQYIDAGRFYETKKGVSPGGYAMQSAIRAGLDPDVLRGVYEDFSQPEKLSYLKKVDKHVLNTHELKRNSLQDVIAAADVPQTEAIVKTRFDPIPKELLRENPLGW